MRLRLDLAAAVLVVATGCVGDHVEQARFGPPPHCSSNPEGRAVLVAQSVPTAHYVPCYSTLPAGIELKSIDVDSSGSRLLFDIDRYDEPIWMRFEASCRIEDKESRGSGHLGVESFVGRSEDGRVALGRSFPGGCLVFEFGEDSLVETAEARALVERVRLVPREELRESSGWDLPGDASP